MDIQMPDMHGVEALNWPAQYCWRFKLLTSADTPINRGHGQCLGGVEERFRGRGSMTTSQPFRQRQLLAMLTQHIRLAAPADSGDAGASGASASGPRSESGSLGGADLGASVLDAEALERLRELDPNGENHLLERVVNAFETSLGRLLPQLQGALDSNELGGIRHVAHTLKSSSASIGAMKLSRMCSDVESRARQEQSEGMSELVAQLQAEVEIARAALKRILGA
jgi:HPt (histidine-containing phosphotransfer) domain-containing protein